MLPRGTPRWHVSQTLRMFSATCARRSAATPTVTPVRDADKKATTASSTSNTSGAANPSAVSPKDSDKKGTAATPPPNVAGARGVAGAVYSKPRIVVIGCGGAGGNAVNNMILSHLEGVDCIVANTDSQALSQSLAPKRIQLGLKATQGLGAGARHTVGRTAAEESITDVLKEVDGAHMCFITAGMGGGTGTGASPVLAREISKLGILTVGVVTKPFPFEGAQRMKTATTGLDDLESHVDTLIVLPNENLMTRVTERTSLVDAFRLSDSVLHMGVRSITDLMVVPGLINLDFADVRAIMHKQGRAMLGTGERTGEDRAVLAARDAMNNELLENRDLRGARGVLINITGGPDMTLWEVNEAAKSIQEAVDSDDANIIFGSTFDETMEGRVRVSIVATGLAPAKKTPRGAAAKQGQAQGTAAANKDAATKPGRASVQTPKLKPAGNK